MKYEFNFHILSHRSDLFPHSLKGLRIAKMKIFSRSKKFKWNQSKCHAKHRLGAICKQKTHWSSEGHGHAQMEHRSYLFGRFKLLCVALQNKSIYSLITLFLCVIFILELCFLCFWITHSFVSSSVLISLLSAFVLFSTHIVCREKTVCLLMIINIKRNTKNICFGKCVQTNRRDLICIMVTHFKAQTHLWK